jgi:hypothetical protein
MTATPVADVVKERPAEGPLRPLKQGRPADNTGKAPDHREASLQGRAARICRPHFPLRQIKSGQQHTLSTLAMEATGLEIPATKESCLQDGNNKPQVPKSTSRARRHHPPGTSFSKHTPVTCGFRTGDVPTRRNFLVTPKSILSACH